MCTLLAPPPSWSDNEASVRGLRRVIGVAGGRGDCCLLGFVSSASCSLASVRGRYRSTSDDDDSSPLSDGARPAASFSSSALLLIGSARVFLTLVLVALSFVNSQRSVAILCRQQRHASRTKRRLHRNLHCGLRLYSESLHFPWRAPHFSLKTGSSLSAHARLTPAARSRSPVGSRKRSEERNGTGRRDDEMKATHVRDALVKGVALACGDSTRRQAKLPPHSLATLLFA